MEARGLKLLGHSDLDGCGDGMGLAIKGGRLYVAHEGKSAAGLSIVDVSVPGEPRLVRQLPRDEGTRWGKVVVVGDILLVSCERILHWQGPPFVRPSGGAERWTSGMRIFDVADRDDPREVGFFPVAGTGVHRMTYTSSPYAYLTADDDGYTDQFLRIVDLSDPRLPVEVGRWWWPGMWVGGGERPRFPKGRRYALHHALREGDLLYCGWWDAGLVILDVSDIRRPQLVSTINWGPGRSGATHTALPLPGRDLLAVTDEAIVDGCGADIPKQVRLIDVRDPYSPHLLSTLPTPVGDFCQRGGRFGPHNLAEPRPYTHVDTNRLFVTWFNAGLRVFDIRDPRNPTEEAYLVPDAPTGQPACQVNDVAVGEDRRIYLTDRVRGGVWVAAAGR